MMRLLAAAGLLALAVGIPAARAGDDDLRLALPAADDAATRTLGADADDLSADTLKTRYYGYRGGFGGYGGGYRGGFYGGGYRGFGGYYGGGYRGIGYGGYGWGGYRGGYYGGGYGWGGYRGLYAGYYPRYYGGFYPSYYGGYYPGYYSTYSYPIVSSYYYTPCSVVTAAAPATTLDYRILPSTPTPANPGLSTTPTLPAPMPKADGTFPYNGGPAAPVPMPPPLPKEEEAMTLPRVPTPIIDRVVSLTDEPTTGKFVYPAYGEEPRRAGK